MSVRETIPAIRFDPRIFAKHTWSISDENRTVTVSLGESWREYQKAVAEVTDNGKRAAIFTSRDVGVALRWDSRIANYESILGNNTYLMTSYLREWQRVNLYDLVPHSARIFDIGIGTGRSEPLWRARNATVFGVEPDRKNVEKLISRRIQQISEVRAIAGEDPAIQRWIPCHTIDCVYMSYSITFFYRNRKTLDALVQNIRHVLRPGGIFVCIGFDGKVVESWLKAGKGKVDTACVTITAKPPAKQAKQAKEKIFNREITITVKNPYTLVESQKEYLTDFNELKNRLTDFETVLDTVVPAASYLGPAPSEFVSAIRVIVCKRSKLK